MREDAKLPDLTFRVGEKIHAVEFFQNRSESIIAVGTKSSVIAFQINFDESQSAVGSTSLFMVKTGCRVQCLAWSPMTSVICSPRILSLAIGCADFNVTLATHDLNTSESVQPITLKGHKDYVNAVVYHPEDGSQVVSGSDDHTVMLWDTSNGARMHTVTFCSAVMSLAWHPDEVSKLLIGVKNGVIHIFNIASYHAIMSLDCGTGPLSWVDWSLSKSSFVAVAVRSDISIWDLTKMAPVWKSALRADLVRTLKIAAFSENTLATVGLPNYNVKVFNTKNNNSFRIMSNLPVGGISWHPKKPILAVGHDDKVSLFYIHPNKIQ